MCSGWIGNIEASRERVRDLLPAAFEPEVNDLPGTAGMVFRAYECERAAMNQTVQTNVGLFMLYARVVPVDERWRTPDFHEFLLDFLVGDARLVETIRNTSFPAGLATVARHPGPMPDRSETWEVTGATGHAEFSGLRFHDSQDAGELHWYLWYAADNGFRRAEIDHGIHQDRAAPQAGVLTGDGMRGFQASETGSALPYTGAPVDHYRAVMVFNETTYR